MAALRDRFEEHGRRPNVRYTQAIVNHGREAGASIAHPHGQLLGMPFVPGELAEELAGFVRFGEACLLCTTVEAELSAGHRVVLRPTTGSWWPPRSGAACPSSCWSSLGSTAPTSPRPSPATSPPWATRCATCSGKLRRAVGDVAYNVVFHTAPHHHRDEHYHWHVHVVPRLTSVAGFEQGTGVLINIVAPEIATQRLVATD